MGKKKTELTFEYEDVQAFMDGCSCIGMEMNLPFTGHNIDYEDIYGTQSYYFAIIDNDSTHVGVTFSLYQLDDSVILDWDLICSSDIEDKVNDCLEEDPQAFGEFPEHNSPLEAIRDNGTEIMDLIESKLHEIVDDLQSAGLV